MKEYLIENQKLPIREFLILITLVILTAAAIITSAASAVETASAAAGWTLGHWARLIDDNLSAIDLVAIVHFNGCRRALIVDHGYETESTGSAGHLVSQDKGIFHFSGFRERIAQRFAGRVV